MAIIKRKSKSGKVYFYPAYYETERDRGIIPKRERRVSKAGNVYYTSYKRRRIDGEARYSILNRLRCKERDGFTCQLCGSTLNLHAHHVDNEGKHKTPNPNNELDNLITLCHSCHIKMHYLVNDRWEDIKALHQEGLTLQTIGDIYGVSRQRIHQILKLEIAKEIWLA